jgi:UDP-3-O-[3-hydroxymyristoyl] glucosamine N-acyltransferase
MAGRAGLSLGELAATLGATLEGDPGRVVHGVAPLDRAGPDQIAFVADVRYQKAAQMSRAGAFLAPADVSGLPGPVLRCPVPRLALIDLLTLFHPPSPPAPGIAASAIVAPEARVAPSAWVGALSVVEAGAVIGARVRLYPLVYVGPGVEIGEDSVLYPHVVVRDGVRLGRRVIVHPGAVIGADGFGYAFDGARHRKIPQVGGVRVEDDVEIGANTTVDRATLGDTVVGQGTKIDNLVQVGHNVEIGEHTVIAGQTGIAGSVRVGRGVTMGGQVGINNHVSIGDGAVLAAQSGVAQDAPAGERLAGTPAQPLAQARRIWVAQAQVPDLVRQVRALERRLARLEARLGEGG